MSGFVGNGPSGAGRTSRFQFSAAAGQVTFSGVDQNGLTLNYVPNYVEVAINGIWLPPSDYAATDGSTVTLPNGCVAADVLYVYALSVFSAADTFSKAQNGADILAPAAFRANIAVPGVATSNKFTDATPSTGTTTGALTIAGGLGVAGAINAGGTVTSAANPSTTYQFDGSTTAITIANGASASLPVGSGLFICRIGESISNGVAILCSGGICAVLGQIGTLWEVNTTTPAAGHASVVYDGAPAYRIYNNQGATQNFHVVGIRCFAAN